MWKVSQPSTFTKNENFATRQLIDLGQKINFVDYTLMTTWSNLIQDFLLIHPFMIRLKIIIEYLYIAKFIKIMKIPINFYPTILTL